MKLLIADDHALFRCGLRAMLSAHGIHVVGEAGHGREALELTLRLCPDVVLMDLAMPEMDGIEATRRIRRESPHIQVVVLTASREDRDLFAAIRAGAQGYLQKDLSAEQVVGYLRGLPDGIPAMTPRTAHKLMVELATTRPAEALPFEALTEKEEQVLKTMVDGITTNRSLATHLSITENTVKFHVRNILNKLHSNNRAQAVSHAVRHCLVDIDDSAPRRLRRQSFSSGRSIS